MAKNNTTTIFNILNAKTRKKEITNTDRKEVRQAYTDLAAEIMNGYRLSTRDYETLNNAFNIFGEEIRAADERLPDEQRRLVRTAINETKQAVERLNNAAPTVDNSNTAPAPDTNNAAPEPDANNAAPEPDANNAAPEPDANNAEPHVLDLSVLNKPQNELTAQDREILQNIINSPYTTDTAKANARQLFQQPDNNNTAPELDTNNTAPDPDANNAAPDPDANNAEPHVTENSAEDRQAALASIATEKKPWQYSTGSITPASIEAAMNSDDPDKALANVDDLVAAQAYFNDDKDKSSQLNTIVSTRLQHLSPADITPANADSYRLLCMQCNDDTLRQAGLDMIADAIIQYDKEHFGSFKPDTKEIADNYDKVHTDLKNKDPFACKYDPEKDTLDLGSVEFTDAAGKPLNEKETQKQKEAIASLAREMAAQRLAKSGTHSPEEMEQAYKDATAEIIWGSSPKYGKNGKPQVDKDALASTIANQYLQTETFKDRCKQKFQNNPLTKKVTKNVEKIDKKLENRYGKKYVYAKQALKFVGKISGTVAKNAAIYGVAGLVPGGTAVVIGYNVCKNWKNIKQQLKDPNASVSKKCAMIAGACASTALSGLGMASSIGTAIEAANMVSPGMVDSAVSFMGQLGTYGRLGVSAAATMLPNITENISLRLQNWKLNRQIKNEKDGEKLQQLIAQQKALQVKRQNNKKEMRLKGGALVTGIITGQALMPHIASFVQEEANNAVETIKSVTAEHGIDPWKTGAGTAPWQDPNYDPNKPEWLKENAFTGEEKNPYAGPYRPGMEPQNTGPDEVNGIKAHETNLSAAKAENSSGIEGKSAFDHTKQHLDSLGDSRITDTNAVAEGLSEHIGKNANLATIACKMAPYALQDVLKIEGLPNDTPTSYNMIQYMATHDLTPEQNAALNNFIEKNFDGAHFKAENFPDYQHKAAPDVSHRSNYEEMARVKPEEIARPDIKSNIPSANVQLIMDQNGKIHTVENTETANKPLSDGEKVANYLNEKYAGQGMTFTAVENPHQENVTRQPVHQEQTTVVRQQPQETVVVQQPEVDIYSNPALYAQHSGLRYDPYLSNGLDRIGSDNHGGYLGVFVDPRDGSVTVVPNDPVHDKPVHYSSIKSAKESFDHYTGPWDHSGHRDLAYDPDKRITHCHGSGIITHNNTINKVIAGIGAVHNVINTVNYIRGREC